MNGQERETKRQLEGLLNQQVSLVFVKDGVTGIIEGELTRTHYPVNKAGYYVGGRQIPLNRAKVKDGTIYIGERAK